MSLKRRISTAVVAVIVAAGCGTLAGCGDGGDMDAFCQTYTEINGLAGEGGAEDAEVVGLLLDHYRTLETTAPTDMKDHVNAMIEAFELMAAAQTSGDEAGLADLNTQGLVTAGEALEAKYTGSCPGASPAGASPSGS
jgi:hypothetical protein